ncbi:MAG: RsmB/NOP family class I SAM-dependent RNA methyltransferase [Oscillospiraceae bacterium]|nr:RsmB/NOP family class I SAM-dependent RNA methyltransferase [Oscillospiraceae bacterium]
MLPDTFQSRMRRLLGPDFTAFLASYDRPRAVALRRNPLKSDCLPPFSLSPVPWVSDGFYYDPAQRPGLHPWHDAGLYYLQEASAMAPAALLNPQPGETVLDLCAAPGGKSTQLAAMLRGRGLLVCNEISPQRARILSQNMERMGISNALVLNERPARLAERLPRVFDRVLVDAPCSGEGMFRKEAAAVQDWSEETVRMCARRQREILESAAQTVKAGGFLVYSTCTFAPEENEGVVSAFLHDHPEFSLPEVAAPWFSPGRPDAVPDPAPHLARTFRLFPHLLRGEGHFAAVLQYNGTEASFLPMTPAFATPPELTDFLRDTDIALPDGTLLAFGAQLFLAPAHLPPLHGLRVLRPGLCLGACRKGRFEPDHALALFLKDSASVADFPPDSTEIARFLRGETLPCLQTGWTLVEAGGLSLGWAKGSGGVLKNHYPKGLRHSS